MTPYKLHLLQQLKDTDELARENLYPSALKQDGFDDRLVLSDEATFHLTGKIKHNTRKTEHPDLTLVHFHKLNVFCAILKKRVHCFFFFFFEERTASSEVYLAMLQNGFIKLLIEEEQADFIFLHGGAPSHGCLTVRPYSA